MRASFRIFGCGACNTRFTIRVNAEKVFAETTKVIVLDYRLDPRYVGKAVYLLNAGGYTDATKRMFVESSVRAVAFVLAGASRRRQKTVLELIELAVDDFA